MEKWTNKTAFVGGANSGMGAALTRKFLESDIKVYGLDKNVDFLDVSLSFIYELQFWGVGEIVTISNLFPGRNLVSTGLASRGTKRISTLSE